MTAEREGLVGASPTLSDSGGTPSPRLRAAASRKVACRAVCPERVSPEMMDAGALVLDESGRMEGGGLSVDRLIAEEVFLAMLQVYLDSASTQ